MTTEKKLPAWKPMQMPPSDVDLMHAGKRPAEMTAAELVACAVHFRDEHVAAVHTIATMARRMKKLEEAVGAANVRKLDLWLKAHPVDAFKGDGSELYPNWQKWQPPTKT